MLPKADHLAAILPVYTEAGDTTTIITRDGTATSVNTKIKSVIQRLARTHSLDLISLRKNCAALTGRSLHQPLPITPGLVLIPVKVRKARVAGDNCTGYINYYAIHSAGADPHNPYQSILTLSAGTPVTALWNIKTLNSCLASARLVIGAGQPAAAGHTHIQSIAHKLVEVIYEILSLKDRS
jgi:hypothetical protein